MKGAEEAEKEEEEMYLLSHILFFLILVVSESVEESQNEYGTIMIPKFLLFKASHLFY